MRLVLARHGETLENIAGIVQGHIGGTLSEDGRYQAECLARFLKDEMFSAIYTSDLDRAYDTTCPITKNHPDTPVYPIELLRERHLGSAQGKVLTLQELIRVPDIEPEKVFLSRIESFLDMLPDDGNYLAVTHAGTILGVLSIVQKVGFDKALGYGRLGNTSVTIFDPYPEITMLNSTEHLKYY